MNDKIAKTSPILQEALQDAAFQSVFRSAQVFFTHRRTRIGVEGSLFGFWDFAQECAKNFHLKTEKRKSDVPRGAK